jgi:hypothetical protein
MPWKPKRCKRKRKEARLQRLTETTGKHRKSKESAEKLVCANYYDVTLFNRAYDWMKARGMSEGQSQHAALVVG